VETQQAFSFFFRPAIKLSNMLGFSRSLILFALAMLAFSASLTYLAFSATQINAKPLTSSTDLIVFSSLATFLLLYFLIGFLIYMRKGVQTLNASAHDIISGNFSTSPFSTDSDDIAKIQNNLAHIAKEFDRLFKRISESASEAHCAAEAESEVSNKTSNSSSQQADAVSGVSAAIEQLSTSIGGVTEQIKETEQASTDTQKLAEQGSIIVKDTVNNIQNIEKSMNQAITLIDSLGKRSNEINQIISVIEEIASQTNLLALNAAIEAARAGEHGRGFAVVSDEVRQLAIRTHDATEQVSGMINGVQIEVKGIIKSITGVNDEVRSSAGKSDKINQSLSQIQEGAKNTVVIMHEAASSIHEQSAVCEEIARSIETISRMAETNSEDADETKQTANYLETLSKRVLTMLPNSATSDKNF